MNSVNMIQLLFGPLDASYCNYFYYMSIFFFAILCFTAFNLAKKVFSGKKVAVQEMVIVLLQPFLLYFINRLYFSMCAGSLRN
jgi:hypothetical protein